MSDVQPSDAAAHRALHAVHGTGPCVFTEDRDCSVLAGARAALAAGMRVKLAALADAIRTETERYIGSPQYADGIAHAARIVRAAAGGTPNA